MGRMKFNLRDLFWLSLVVVLAICWWLAERRSQLAESRIQVVNQESERNMKAHDKGWLEMMLSVKPDPRTRPSEQEIIDALRRFEEREAMEAVKLQKE
jgi:hypothetical protein